MDYAVALVLIAHNKKTWTDFTIPVVLSNYRDHRPVRTMISTKTVLVKVTSTQRPPRRNSDTLLEARWERYAEVRWGMTLTKKKFLDERRGRNTYPAGAHNYLEHHMDKNVLPHFGRTRRTHCDTRDEAQQNSLRRRQRQQRDSDDTSLDERYWRQDEELDVRIHALKYIFEKTADEDPVTKVDDPKEQSTVTTGCSEGPLERSVKYQTNCKTDPNTVRNEEEQLTSASTTEVWKFYLFVMTTFCTKVWFVSWQGKMTSPALKTSEIVFLNKIKKNAADPVNEWRTISLLSYGVKAQMRSIWLQILPKVTPKISETQFGE